MARTEEGGLLTVRHRQGQIALRAQLLRDFQSIWPIWRGDESSFRLLVSATIPLVGLRREASSALGSAYYEMFRRTEGVGGASTPRPADPVPDDVLTTSLYVTGFNSVLKSIEAGFSPQAAQQNAFVKVTGAITRHTLNGSRESILRSTAADQQARGWARVTGGNPCAFCAVLASRGAAYAEDTVDFRAHDHCTCEAEPLYADSALPPDSQRFKDLYNEVASGSDDPIGAMREALAAA